VSNIVLEWKPQAFVVAVQTQTYIVTWHNANPTAMNAVANYSFQAMGSPDYIGAVHQVLDGTMLDLDVSASFLRDAVAVGGGYAVGVTSVGGGYAMGGVAVGFEVVEGGDALVGGGMIVAVDQVRAGGQRARVRTTMAGVGVGRAIGRGLLWALSALWLRMRPVLFSHGGPPQGSRGPGDVIRCE
jgi:hypothetical protein